MPHFFAFTVRPAAGLVASALLIASTRLTWAGLVAVAVFCLLVFDAQRRVRRVLDEMDDVNCRLDVVVSDIEELKTFIASGDGAPDST